MKTSRHGRSWYRRVLRAWLWGVVALQLAACAARSGSGVAPTMPALRDASDFVSVEVASVGIDVERARPVALLHERWQRVLPLSVGSEEALAIARARSGVPVSRPLTHDLLADVLEGLGGTLESVLVYQLRDDVYYGLLRVRVDGELREFDARPSDGVALAVRTGASIRVDPSLFESAADIDFISMEGERPVVRMRGITVSSVDVAAGAMGVLVLHAGGEGSARAVRRGDIIQRVDGHDIDSPSRFLEAVQARPADSTLNLDVLRDGDVLQLRVFPQARSTRRS